MECELANSLFDSMIYIARRVCVETTDSPIIDSDQCRIGIVRLAIFRKLSMVCPRHRISLCISHRRRMQYSLWKPDHAFGSLP